MTATTSASVPPLVSITPWSLDSVGDQLTGVHALPISGSASAAWPAADRGLFVPFALTHPFRVVQMFAYNGASVAGNTDVGIYSEDLTRLVSMGPTAQAGLNVLQAFDLADTVLGPGVFYMALSSSSGAATFFRRVAAVETLRAIGAFQQASVATLPATATVATITSAYLPVFGLSGRVLL